MAKAKKKTVSKGMATRSAGRMKNAQQRQGKMNDKLRAGYEAKADALRMNSGPAIYGPKPATYGNLNPPKKGIQAKRNKSYGNARNPFTGKKF